MKLTANSKISYNARYLTVDDRPWFPVMGEIHYSRVKRSRWERELLKMKAGGVSIASAYAIWIHHEEIEGQWDFEDNKDLRTFVETVKRCGMYMFLRIGPWAHGEVRNGGFPDWLVDKERTGQMRLRSDDPGYLAYAGTFYEHIYRQVEGLLLKDGGPIIGVQIENEYGHCGGLQGAEGEQHMRTLLCMAREIGFDVPLYTATGWGGAVTGGMLPVMGGYCEAPWDQRLTEIEPNGNYLFTEERNDHNIGSDYGLGAGITFSMEDFPYLTAELGGGLQVTGHRRPVAKAKDILGMSLAKLGSGCNLLGYYMYHGGTNPDGKRTTLQESRATGYPNDLPVKSYDFNAPVREYGQLTDTYREIRRLAMFVTDYQEMLCRSIYVPQPGNPGKPEDLHSIRSAVRLCTETESVYGENSVQAGESAPAGKKAMPGESFYAENSIPAGNGIQTGDSAGFYFLSNYQRRYPMAEHRALSPTAYDAQGHALAVYDVMDVKDGDLFFRPFNLQIGSAVLKTTNAMPLCIMRGEREEEKTYVFYVRDGALPDYRLKGQLGNVSLLTLTDQEALHAVKLTLGGREYLLISEGDAVQTADGQAELLWECDGSIRPAFKIWPALPQCPAGFRCVREAGRMHRTGGSSVFAEYVYERKLCNPVTVTAEIIGQGERQWRSDDIDQDEKAARAEHIDRDAQTGRVESIGQDMQDLRVSISLEAETSELNIREEAGCVSIDEVLLKITYAGERAQLYRDHELEADNFYTGQVWEIGVQDDLAEDPGKTWEAVIHPLTDQDKDRLYLQTWPEMPEGRACRIEMAEASVIYRIKLQPA